MFREAGHRTLRKRRVQLFKKRDGVPPSRQGRREAERRARAIVADWYKDLETPEPVGITLQALLEAASVEGGVSAGQVTNRRIAFAKFLRALGEPNPFGEEVALPGRLLAQDVSVVMVDHYLDGLRRSVARATFDRELSHLRRAFNYGVERELIERNPVKKPGRGSSTDQRREEVTRKTLVQEELDKIFAVCTEGYTAAYQRSRFGKDEIVQARLEIPAHLADAFSLMYETGLRPGELVQLHFADVNFEGRAIRVRAEISKTKKPRDIPMTDECRRTLQRIWSGSSSVFVLSQPCGRPVDRRALTRATKRLFDRIGIVGKTLYGFRHAALFRMANSGFPLHKLMKVAGHAKLTTTQIYLESEFSEIRDDFIERMNRDESRQGRVRTAPDSSRRSRGQDAG